MQSNCHSMRNNRNIYAFILLSVLICQIYSNTLHSSWHFDDEPNILLNPSLHLTNLYPSSLADTLISGSDWSNPRFYRPVACFTFALNWYFGQDNPVGYHLVNISIHIITAFFLFLVLLQIMRLTDTKGEESPKNYFIALLGAALWATAPIQTQAVTYIVQRMASLAAMFTILAIYSYLKARTEKKYIRWSALGVLFFLAGIGSKENAAMLPASLLLLEFSFFSHHVSRQKVVWIAVTGLAALLAGFFAMHFLFGKNLLNIFDPSRLIDSYEARSFTLSERILTEPRIVLMYISQIFIPLVSRLSLVHNIQVSTSLLTPWTTLPAIATIFTLLALSGIFLKKYPLFTFPVLFFFFNQTVESTILPLELIFEHRNYLPSFFLFLPMSVLIAQAVYSPNRLSPVGRFAIAAGAVCFLILSGHATYTRNLVWATEGTLWTDGIQKAPSSSRAAHFLGRWLQKNGKYNEAQYYYQRELQYSDTSPNPKASKLTALSSLGSIPYQFGKYDDALHYLDQCLIIDETNEACLKNRAMSYLHLDLPKKALNDAKYIVVQYPTSSMYQYTAALAAYHTGDLVTAQTYLHGTIRKSIDKPYVQHLMGLILLKYKSYPNALFFLRRAADLWPSNAEYRLVLAAAYYLSKDYERAEKVLANVFDRYPVPTIQEAIDKTEEYDVDTDAINYIVDTLNANIEAAVSFPDEQNTL
ncbi:MAG: hypothetical protein D3914_02155 [Candidatus Electrothrix sp. LOE2]|nr:hypothetical protein [Candidatus Electrothrix sp. LOE2]